MDINIDLILSRELGLMKKIFITYWIYFYKSPKHKETIQAYKTLFLPTTKEWFGTSYEEKKDDLQKRMKKENTSHSPGLLLMNLYMDVIYEPSTNNKGIETEMDIPKRITPDIPIFLQILAPGLYLNKCIDPNYKSKQNSKN